MPRSLEGAPVPPDRLVLGLHWGLGGCKLLPSNPHRPGKGLEKGDLIKTMKLLVYGNGRAGPAWRRAR